MDVSARASRPASCACRCSSSRRRVVIAGISLAGGLFALLAFSALAAIVARRAQLWLLDRGLPRWAALVITTGGFVLILVVMGVAVVASIAAVGFRLAEDSAGPGLDRPAQDAVGDRDRRARRHAAADRAAGGPRRRAERRVAALRPPSRRCALSVLIVIYVLLGAKGLHGRMLRATSAEVIARYDVLATELVTYVKVRAALGAGAALADTALLLVLGVPYAVLWGLISFLFSFIPNIGFILALIPPAAFALARARAAVRPGGRRRLCRDQPRLRLRAPAAGVRDDARGQPRGHDRHDPRLDPADRPGRSAAGGPAHDHAARDPAAVPGHGLVRGLPRPGDVGAARRPPPRPRAADPAAPDAPEPTIGA